MRCSRRGPGRCNMVRTGWCARTRSPIVVALFGLGLAAWFSGCGYEPSPGDDPPIPDPPDAALDAAIDAGIDAAIEPCALDAIGPGASTLAGCDEPGDADGPRGVARFHNPVN